MKVKSLQKFDDAEQTPLWAELVQGLAGGIEAAWMWRKIVVALGPGIEDARPSRTAAAC